MTYRLSVIGLLALLLLIAGCTEEINAPSSPVSGHEGTLVPVADAFALAMNPGDVGSAYYVYKPYGYTEDGNPFPVVYMLHGYGGDENYFPIVFGLKEAVDEKIALGELEPMVLVFPNGKTPLGGGFYTDSDYLGGTATFAQHILDVIAEVEAGYNVSTDAATKGIAGASMGGYGALSLAMDNPGMFGFVGVNSAPLAFWGTRTLDPADMTYTGIEELLPTILAQTGYDPATDTPEDYQTKMDPSVGPPTSMMFAMAAAFSPTDAANPGPTSHGTYGVDLPIGLDGEIYMPVWSRWMERDILNRVVNPDPAINDAASFATFDLYMSVGLEDDLGLYGAHQVLEGTLTAVGFPPAVSIYYEGVNDVFGVIPAGHVEHTLPQFLLMLEWFDTKF
ncbi:endo-1,4-beta-xylanase Z precursor [bacterium BMS3Bbin04]|nr:endo-1,4-beta-xylanase Z precursor [bacterium BMS3Bbin04]